MDIYIACCTTVWHVVPESFFINFKEIEFYSAIVAGNVDGQRTEMVAWFVKDLINFNIINILVQFLESIRDYFEIFYVYYNFLILFIFFGIIEFIKNTFKYKKDLTLFILIVLFMSFIQLFMTRKNVLSLYMGGDFFLVCIFFILFYLKKIEPKKILTTVILLCIFLFNTIQLPYVSPFDQQKVEWRKKFKPNSQSLKYFE